MAIKPFKIEQIALCPKNPTLARELLTDLGLYEWFLDSVHASGSVFGALCDNHALLSFNYQAGNGVDAEAGKPLELEVLHYTAGRNWMDRAPGTVSHLGMHCSEKELDEYRAYFKSKGIAVAQEVKTIGHTNQNIANSRRYNYVIFDTREILGVDLKFIVRLPYGADVDKHIAGNTLIRRAFVDTADQQ
jgi:hypothetical protein